MLEQDTDELDYLVGATIKKVAVVKDNDEFGFECIALTVKTKGVIVEDQNGNKSDTVELQVWQDPEGNGPGFLCLTEVVK